MKNKAGKILAFWGLKCSETDNLSKSERKRFCNGFLAFCNGIAKRDGDSDIAKQSRKWLAPSMAGAPCAWAANESDGFEYVVQDTDLVCAANDGDGWYLVAPYGNFSHRVGVQRFDERGADEIIDKYKSIWARLKRAAGFGTTNISTSQCTAKWRISQSLRKGFWQR